jgi:hypothetical protein
MWLSVTTIWSPFGTMIVDITPLSASAWPASSDIICARRTQQPVVTADPDDLRVLDPTINVMVP